MCGPDAALGECDEFQCIVTGPELDKCKNAATDFARPVSAHQREFFMVNFMQGINVVRYEIGYKVREQLLRDTCRGGSSKLRSSDLYRWKGSN